MAFVVTVLAGLAVGAGAFLLSGVDTGGLRFRGRSRVRKAPREWLQPALELLGHQPPLARLARLPRIRRAATLFRGVLSGWGVLVTVEGAFAGFVAMCAFSGLAGWFVSLSLLGAAVGAFASAVLAGAWMGTYERRLQDAQASQMPEVLRSLSSALGSGKSLAQAIEHVGRNVPEPMGAEFLQASFEVKGGCSVEEAVSALCSRVHAPGASLLGAALQISQRTGAPLGELFARTSRMVTETVDLRRELRVKTSQVRLSARVVAAMPVLLCAVLILLSSDYRAGIALPQGRMCLVVALVLDVLALLLVRRTMARSLE